MPAAVAGARATATWQIGVVHGSVSIPGKTDRDDVVITAEEIAGSGLDYLALGHWHSAQKSKAGGVTYAYAGAPEPVALTQDRAGKVLLITLDAMPSGRTITVDERVVGKTRFDKLELDAAGVTSQPALIDSLRRKGDPDLVLDVRIVGIRPDELDLQVDEIEGALAPAFLKVRVRDLSVPALTEGQLPSPDTIAGAFIREMEARIAELEATHGGDGTPAKAAIDEAAELRDALRLGRLLLAGHEVSL
jgi:DNA repair exonuclease SbcCD nuclease subunit